MKALSICSKHCMQGRVHATLAGERHFPGRLADQRILLAPQERVVFFFCSLHCANREPKTYRRIRKLGGEEWNVAHDSICRITILPTLTKYFARCLDCTTHAGYSML